jgi:hypothetical protein
MLRRADHATPPISMATSLSRSEVSAAHTSELSSSHEPSSVPAEPWSTRPAIRQLRRRVVGIKAIRKAILLQVGASKSLHQLQDNRASFAVICGRPVD